MRVEGLGLRVFGFQGLGFRAVFEGFWVLRILVLGFEGFLGFFFPQGFEVLGF